MVQDSAFPKMSSDEEQVVGGAEANQPQREEEDGTRRNPSLKSNLDDVSSHLCTSADRKTSCMTVFTVDCFCLLLILWEGCAQTVGLLPSLSSAEVSPLRSLHSVWRRAA